jgi:uncharacterized membrane protein
MSNLIAAAACFAGLPMLVAGTGLRTWLIQRIGPNAYRGLFSAGTLASLIWLVRAYRQGYATDNAFYWALPYAQVWAGPIMAFALLLAVPGVTSRSPTALGSEALLYERGVEPRGMQRVTRHPLLWGVMIWSGFHLCANGDAASIVLFATFLLVAALGTRSIEARCARALGETWIKYRSKTSNIPFAAIAGGRTRFVFKEIGVTRVLLAVAVFCALVALHPQLFHAYPLPGMSK